MPIALGDMSLASTNLLEANGTLMDLIENNLFDLNNVPDDQEGNYVVLGETTMLSWDTFDKQGQDMTLTIHSWSDYGGKSRLDEIRSEIYSTLHGADLDMGNYSGTMVFDNGYVLLDNTSNIKRLHGVDRFRIKAQEI